MKPSSDPTLAMYSDPTTAVMPTPGGTNHHHVPKCSAPHDTEWCIISPRETPSVGPRPMKSSPAAISTAPPNSRMKDMTR